MMRRGFTIIELLIGLTIVMVLLTAVAFAIVSASRSIAANRDFTEATDKARAAMTYLASHIRKADRVHVGAGLNIPGRHEATALFMEVPQVVSGVEITNRISCVYDSANRELLIDTQPWASPTNNPSLSSIRSRKTGANPSVFVLCRDVEASFAGTYEEGTSDDPAVRATYVDIDLSVSVGQQTMRLTDSVAVRRALPLR